MKILVMGAGMMGWAAAFDMARSSRVEAVTLADSDAQRLDEAVARINKLTGNHKVTSMQVDAADTAAVLQLMRGHDSVLSAVPYFFNLELAKAAIEAGCHFADLGGNNTVVKQEFALHDQAQAAGVAIAPDCGLSPGMASILGGELLRRIGGKVLSPHPSSYIVELTSTEVEIGEFIANVAAFGQIVEVVRSGVLGISRANPRLHAVK